ncbi:hypothetical protein PC9H_006668 [Pleurotus ostreatus]|uniref:Uncharacterized protein n=1 Tax=Pleurotus ostreatus TaxID=5322 RepID=A0A8H7DT85_PLEOS|nr:uncharacterized protein PC9H_006668 [Pleurotus ostreatus]KAF7430953.1 hypothetical protein PC9H_006668 [Pleurotus ostreatus]
MGRALFSISHPVSKPDVQVRTEPEPQEQLENWSRINAFDPDSDEFFANAVYEAVIPADTLTQLATLDQLDPPSRDRDRQNAGVGVGAEAGADGLTWFFDTARAVSIGRDRDAVPGTRFMPGPEQQLTFRQRQALASVARRTRSASVSALNSTTLPPLVPLDQSLVREQQSNARLVNSAMLNWAAYNHVATHRPRLERRESHDSSPDSSAPATPNPEAMNSSRMWTENTSLGADTGASPLPPPSAQLPFIPPDTRQYDNLQQLRTVPSANAIPMTYVPLLNIDGLSESRRRSSISERRPSISEQRNASHPERRAVAVRRSMGNGVFGVDYAPVSGGPLPNPNARISHTWQSASPPAYHPIPVLRVPARV